MTRHHMCSALLSVSHDTASHVAAHDQVFVYAYDDVDRYFKDQQQVFSERLGTSCYVAPEVLKQKYYPAKADLWSLGATVFMMLAGEAPFHGVLTAGVCKWQR